MSCANEVPDVGDGDGDDTTVTDGDGDGVTVTVGDGVTITVGDGVGVSEPPGAVTWKEVTVAITPLCIWVRRPQKPDDKEVSVLVTIQLVGSVLLVCQTFA